MFLYPKKVCQKIEPVQGMTQDTTVTSLAGRLHALMEVKADRYPIQRCWLKEVRESAVRPRVRDNGAALGCLEPSQSSH